MEKSKLQIRLEQQLKAKGNQRYETLAQHLLETRGHIEKGTYNLTPSGQKRNDLGNEGRAVDRKVGIYNPDTNRTSNAFYKDLYK